jgi:hypothetical protein
VQPAEGALNYPSFGHDPKSGLLVLASDNFQNPSIGIKDAFQKILPPRSTVSPNLALIVVTSVVEAGVFERVAVLRLGQKPERLSLQL